MAVLHHLEQLAGVDSEGIGVYVRTVNRELHKMQQRFIVLVTGSFLQFYSQVIFRVVPKAFVLHDGLDIIEAFVEQHHPFEVVSSIVPYELLEYDEDAVFTLCTRNDLFVTCDPLAEHFVIAAELFLLCTDSIVLP